MKRTAVRAMTVAAAAILISTITVACSSSNTAAQTSAASGSSTAAKAALDKQPQPDFAYLEALGWKPTENSVPNLACTDDSYANAVKNGINLGIYNAQPYEYIDKTTQKPAGLDWDINMAVLKYLGIEKYTAVNLQWDGMIPALQSNRIDVITGNIHETADRLKNIEFTTPAWWYGSSMMVPESNPGQIKSWTDLTKKGVKVGVVNGSQSQTYLESIKADIVPYQDSNTMFASLQGGREDVILDDGPKEAAYIQANPNDGLKLLTPPDVPPSDLLANYARYGIRIGDCTLNNAYSRALSELRNHGVIEKILAKYGLEQNLFEPQYRPK